MTPITALVIGFRFALGPVFLASGAAKVHRPRTFRRAVSNYRLVPYRLVSSVAIAVIFLELFAGVTLLTGLLLWWAAAATLVLGVTFTVAIGVNLLLGRRPKCGCFGIGETISERSLTRALFVLAASVALLWAATAHTDLTGDTASAVFLQVLTGLGVLVLAVWLLTFGDVWDLIRSAVSPSGAAEAADASGASSASSAAGASEGR